MTFQKGYFLLFLVPLFFLWYFTKGRDAFCRGLRALMLFLFLLIAAGPMFKKGTEGTDLVVIVDRSRSCSGEQKKRQEEILDILSNLKKRNDRLGIVVFGKEAFLVSPLSAKEAAGSGSQEVDPDGSDLAEALQLALSMIPANRNGRILILSDGRYTGASPLSVAAEASARSIPMGFVWLGGATKILQRSKIWCFHAE